MAYKRWSFSNWYIFWIANDCSHIEEEQLACWHVTDENAPSITYTQAIKYIVDKDHTSLFSNIEKLSKEDINELSYAIENWIIDISKEYKEVENGDISNL
jgi:hypothetical protein